jgi:hypothetical protein
MSVASSSIAWQILSSITESTVSQEIPAISDNIEWQLRAAVSSSTVGQLQLAIHAGISPVQLSRFVQGQQSIMLDTAARLAAMLGLQLSPISAAAPPVSGFSEPVAGIPATTVEKPQPESADAVKPKAPRRQPMTEKRVLSTLESLAAASGVTPDVRLADLREKLGGDRAAVDAMLIALHSSQKLALTAAGDQPLTDDEQVAALMLDDRPHLLCRLTTSPASAAKPSAKRSRRS